MENTKQTNNNTENKNSLSERQDETQVRNERSCLNRLVRPIWFWAFDVSNYYSLNRKLGRWSQNNQDALHLIFTLSILIFVSFLHWKFGW